MHWVSTLSIGPWIESFQDSWWDPEFPQLSQMVPSLPGFLNLCLNVCSPSQVLWDVYTEVLEAAHPLHRGPTDHKRGVGPLLSLPEVHDQLFSFAHVQRETVVLAPWCKSLYLIQVCGLIIVGNEAQNHSIISKFDNRSGAVRGHAVVCVERVEQGAQDTTLWGSYVQGDGVGGELSYFHHLRWEYNTQIKSMQTHAMLHSGNILWKLCYKSGIFTPMHHHVTRVLVSREHWGGIMTKEAWIQPTSLMIQGFCWVRSLAPWDPQKKPLSILQRRPEDRFT